MHPNKCLEVVRRNYDKIMEMIEEILRQKGLRYKELYVFQSRAIGICRSDSDLDIYVQLADEHRELVETKGIDCFGVKIMGWGRNGVVENHIQLDLMVGMSPTPPAKPKYKNMKYYVNLKELASLASSQK